MARPLHSSEGSKNQRAWARQGAGYMLRWGFGGKTEKEKGRYLRCPEILSEAMLDPWRDGEREG